MSQLKNYIFAIVCLTIALPLLQSNFSIIKPYPKPLYGENPKPNTDFFPPKWDNGEFQEIKEQYLNQNFGLRNWIVRAHNELEYRLLGKINYRDAKLGKNDMLYYQKYLDDYAGFHTIREEDIRKKMDNLLALKDTLAKRNIALLVMFAPSKAHFYPESMPKGYEIKGKNQLYDYLTTGCKNRNIPYIDFNNYFISLKNKSQYPLFTSTGIHWTIYGAGLAMDSLFRRIEQEKKVDLPDFYWNKLEISDTTRAPDNDLMQLANLFTTFKTPKLAYPEFIFKQKEGQKKIKTLTVGDSFWWNIYNSGANENMFGEFQFWYYCRDINPSPNGEKVDKSKMYQEIEKYDLIILESTSINLDNFGFGFIEEILQHYQHQRGNTMPPEKLAKLVNEWIERINNTPDWLQNLEEGAKKENISLDSMRHRIALYMIEKELNKE